LNEVRDWLAAPEHSNEIVMLYLENQMQQNGVDSPDAHTQATAAIQAAFGNKIYKPAPTVPANTCTDLPLDISRADIRNAGKQIIITGNCYSGGASPWNGLVFSRSDRWKESGLDHGTDFTPERCAADRVSEDYPHNWIRHWGDETGLSDSDPTALESGHAPAGGGDVTVEDATNMVRCGVNMIGLDLLEPFDARLAALVWSWDTNEPQQNSVGACAVSGSDARFRSDDCTLKTKTMVSGTGKNKKFKVVDVSTKHPFACFDGTAWHVTKKSDSFSKGGTTCAAEGFGAFAVPRSGRDNDLLHTAKGATPDVWVNSLYKDAVGWTPGS
jgi:hypothetical protein